MEVGDVVQLSEIFYTLGPRSVGCVIENGGSRFKIIRISSNNTKCDLENEAGSVLRDIHGFYQVKIINLNNTEPSFDDFVKTLEIKQ